MAATANGDGHVHEPGFPIWIWPTRPKVAETLAKSRVLSALAPASIACAELKLAGGQAASKIPSTATVLRRRSSYGDRRERVGGDESGDGGSRGAHHDRGRTGRPVFGT